MNKPESGGIGTQIKEWTISILIAVVLACFIRFRHKFWQIFTAHASRPIYPKFTYFIHREASYPAS